MLRERRLRRVEAAPLTLRSPGLVKVARSSTPDKLRDLIASALVRLQLALEALDAVEVEARHA